MGGQRNKFKWPGEKFCRLTIVSYSHNKNGKNYYNTECLCGNKKKISLNDITSGRTQSCGCLHIERTILANTTHGHGGKIRTATYACWANMISRCNSTESPHYKYYGGRGISVCQRWLRFENFLTDMGEQPVNLTIDRINNDGNYEPNNCRWATRKEQRRNNGQLHKITFNGETLLLTDWAARVGITASSLLERFDRGWSVEQALTGRRYGRIK